MGGRALCPCAPAPPPLPPPITLARMSMVVQVSMSCMDTGVCPSAWASRISTSCSAFSLKIPIRLTKELGNSTRISGPWDEPRPGDIPHRPSPEGAAWSCGPLPALLDAPQGPAHESGTQESNLTFTAPLLSGWLPSRYPDFNAPRIFRLPLGPSTPTSRRCGNAGTTADSGEGGTKGLWGHLESIESPSNLSVLAAHSPYLPCWGAPPQPFVIPRCSLPFGNHSAQPYVDVSLETQRSKPAAALTRDSYLPGLSACQTA